MLGKCLCKGCNQPGTIAIGLNRRGNRNAYMCDFHARYKASYSTRNNYVDGKRKAHGFTFGVELETSRSTRKARIEIEAQGFIPTSDATVDVEYKSSIMRGLNGLAKYATTWQMLIDANELEINNTCGTHTHIGHGEYITPDTIGYVRRFCNSLFKPLSEAIASTPEAAAALWGRNFTNTRWATPYNEYTQATNHTNFINLQHSKTLEFRIVKFENAAQYMKAVHCAYDMTKAIIENFIKHFNDDYKDKNRYATIRDYRLHKAETTAKKLVKIYNKYAGLE